MIVTLVAVALAAAAFAAVGYPLLRDRRALALPEAGMPDEYELALEDLVAQRDATYAAIKELDFDQEMGNLPDADYRELRERYRRKAAGILRDLDELQAGPATRLPEAVPEVEEEPSDLEEDAIEREIRRRRRASRRARPAHPCPSCGAPLRPQDRFCAGCGAPVPCRACSIASCPSCGVPYQPEDRFCAHCGGALAEVVR